MSEPRRKLSILVPRVPPDIQRRRDREERRRAEAAEAERRRLAERLTRQVD